MWQRIERLMRSLRRATPDRDGASARPTRLEIETLEQRTVLSANFVGDEDVLERLATREPPRMDLFHDATDAPFALFAEGAPKLFVADRGVPRDAGDTPFLGDFAENGSAENYEEQRFSSTDRQDYKGPLGLRNGGAAIGGNIGGGIFEDLQTGAAGADEDPPPLMMRSPGSASDERDQRSVEDNFVASTFSSLQPPPIGALVERIANARHTALLPMVVTTGNDALEGDVKASDDASLLASSMTLANSTVESRLGAAERDSAFEGYSPLSSDETESDAYLQQLAEDQMRDASAADAGGLADAVDDDVFDSESRSNAAADKQVAAIEEALRSLAARRGDARPPSLASQSEYSWQPRTASKNGEAKGKPGIEDPGGMILLQTLAAADELLPGGDASQIVETAIEMEATIGVYQAFDVSVDAAPSAAIETIPAADPSQAHGGDAQQSSGATGRQASAGLGGIAVGAMILAANRQRNAKRRRPQA
ncbi:hypothetical protein [Lacipirellula parvula]|uniref:Uncharacterized protein n=1 Tax=Lacipirellula parvula TaxID=2650471 RepID=A0A5K7XFE1_9BACT|nr:hypothetical protein [Lacipirellula parvula]BBO33056.1 hypothetical protein PLANPX_2668 [Lacipirellula parvula]